MNMMRDTYEATIRRYFTMWLEQDGAALDEIFTPDIYYSECYGPEYHDIGQVARWFSDWNACGRVLRWDIKQMLHAGDTVVAEWFFSCEHDGKRSAFDGVSIVEFEADGRIRALREFQSRAEHYLPYAEDSGR